MQIPGLQITSTAEGLAALPWRATRYEGIDWLDLVALQSHEQEGAADAVEPRASQTVLIRMAPGCGYPRHRHIGPEDVLVLSGGYRDDDGRTFEAGQFVRYSKGSEHAPVAIGSVASDGSSDGPPDGPPDGPSSDTAPAEPCILFAVAHQGTELSDPSVPSSHDPD